jgi:hypothetical protein
LARWERPVTLPLALSRISGAIIVLTCALTCTVRSQEGPKNATILIIRHAEKPENGTGLTPAGEQRAQAYVRYFRDFTVDSKPLHLDAIFATADSAASQRPQLTVGPLANALGLPINTHYADKQVAKLANKLRATQQGKSVLICWHHGEIPDLLRALGAKPETLLPKGSWPGHIFDWVIQLRYDHNGQLIPEQTRRLKEPVLPNDPR